MSAHGPHDAAGNAWRVVVALGVAQLVSWGSTYYAFAVFMQPMQRALGADKSAIVGAFSLSLVVAGLLSTWIGARIDRNGGRAVMGLGSLGAVAALVALSQVRDVVQLYLVWALLGGVMAAALYEPAFTVIAQAFQQHYRRAVTALTLIAGFASTIFWPLDQALVDALGWRHALLALAALNLLVCVPLHFFALPRRPDSARVPASPVTASRAPIAHNAASGHPVGQGAAPHAHSKDLRAVLRLPQFWWLAAAFVGNNLVFAAMSVHIVALLQSKGLTAAGAAAIGAMVGPMQVLGRIAEFSVGRRVSSRTVGLLAVWLLPAAMLACLLAGAQFWLLALFAVLYGVSNGVMTIVRGVVPAELFGREHYGEVNGALTAPTLFARAAAPFLASLLWSAFGGYDAVLIALTVTAAASALLFARATMPRVAC